ncbi:MAG TPA: hypothetical protein VGH38_32750 [Bryobacteraceae bacterium]|jgi:glycine cleavage system H lipoate-binding protein
MTCPFLKEAQVSYCRTATVRKLIPTAQTGNAGEKCSSPAHTTCPVYQQQIMKESAFGPCPYLTESLMQYCGAAPVTRFVPYSESLLSRCGNDGFRYCELYLAMAHPDQASEEVDGIALPERLEYSANHMWLDVTDDGTCHAGIDAFLSRALGKIDRISYVWLSGQHRPTAVITVGGTDLEVVFPNPFLLTKCNLYLRADPARITAEPYTGGWLFEGVPGPETSNGLVAHTQAREWMEEEQRRMNQFLQEQQSLEGQCHLAADGGLFAEGVARGLDRDHMLGLFHEFFSPYASRK